MLKIAPPFLLTAIMLFAALTATAQETEQPPFVESTGEATVFGVPTEVSFALRHTDQGDTLEAALNAALVFESAFKAALASHPAQPLSFELHGPVVIDPVLPAVESTVVLRFGLSSLSGGQQNLTAFGVLCDGIRALAEAQGASISAPQLGIAQDAQDALVREAVQTATENAYTAADSAAKALGAPILTINLVQVLETVWNDPAAGHGIMPNLRQYACTASVRVLYELGN
ncbi:MAG: hypothetical protein HYV27_21150 [Candidatus Hydrogenedentes bacterium]|nr:hypothetical protein [Candidatus Hydrogenedentota bacterium]